MKTVHIALIQTCWTGSRTTMKSQVDELVARAAAQGVDLVCLPEFSISPYFASTTDESGFEWAEALPGGESEQFFGHLAKKHHVVVVGSLYEKADDGRCFDTSTIHAPDGNLVYTMRKIHIPSGEGYYETAFFEGWNEYPIAELDAVKMAVPTCYDQWFPEVARICAIRGAELVFYPTAIGSEPTAPDFDSQNAWQTIMRGHAIASGLFIAAANRVGEENGIRFYGSSFVCDPGGKLLASAGRDRTEIVMAELNPQVQQQWRELFPLLHQRRPDAYQPILENTADAVPDRWKDHPSFKHQDKN